jgi:hypothetical protein
MKHKVAYVGLLPLVHHVVVFVNMENVRWYDVVCPPFCPPPRESVMVTFHNHGHGAVSPVQQTLQTYTGFGQLVEIVEINIKDGVHPIMSLAHRCASGAARGEAKRRRLRARVSPALLSHGPTPHFSYPT